MSEKYLRYPVEIFWSYEDECYIAVVPDLPGCSAGGLTYSEALQEVTIAMELWIDHSIQNGEKLPKPSKRLMANLNN